MRLSYLHYDVFTDTPLTGNQLAVFLDARGLDGAQMQALTREMNFSESTFVLPPERADTLARVRIFTPGTELPMAGHPTIGTTFALADIGVVQPGTARLTLGLTIGPTPVDLEWAGPRLQFAWMTQQPPRFWAPTADRQSAAAAIGLSADDLDDTLPVQRVSCGVPFLLIPVRDKARVDQAASVPPALATLMAAGEGEHAVFLFAVEPEGAPDTVYSRMFASGLGMTEDPATGSASGPLGCYLVEHGVVPAGRPVRIVSRQGVKMQRPSRIVIAVDGEPGRITDVKVGGEAVRIGRGEIDLPDAV